MKPDKQRQIGDKTYIGSVSWYDRQWFPYVVAAIIGVILVCLFKFNVL